MYLDPAQSEKEIARETSWSATANLNGSILKIIS